MPFASRLGLMRSGLCCEWLLRRRLRNCSGLPPSPRLLMNSGVTFTRGSRLQTHGEHGNHTDEPRYAESNPTICLAQRSPPKIDFLQTD